MDVQQRVYAAADEVAAAGERVTVSAVRAAARCSMADATAHLRSWRTERATQDAQAVDVPAVPGEVLSVVERETQAVWVTAVRMARQEHEAARIVAAAEVEQVRAEADDIAQAADVAVREAEAATAALMTERAERERIEAEQATALEAARAETEQLRAALDVERERTAQACAGQATAEGVAAGLREALDRIERSAATSGAKPDAQN